MGSEQQVGGIPQEVVRGQRLGVGHIQRRARQLAGTQPIIQRLLVHCGAPAHIDDIGALFHGIQHLPVQDVPGAASAGQAQGYHIGVPDGLLQPVDGIDPVAPVGLWLFRAAHTADGSAHGLQPSAEIAADVAHAHNGHVAVVNGADVADDLPAPLSHQSLIFGHPAHHHQQHADHVLRDGDAVGAGGVGQHRVGTGKHAGPAVPVHAGKGALQPAQVRTLGKQLWGKHPEQDLAVPDVLQGHLVILEEPRLIAQCPDPLGDHLFPAVIVKGYMDGDGLAHDYSPLSTK